MVAGSLCVDGCGMAAVAPHTPAGSKIYPQYISRRLFIIYYISLVPQSNYSCTRRYIQTAGITAVDLTLSWRGPNKPPQL